MANPSEVLSVTPGFPLSRLCRNVISRREPRNLDSAGIADLKISPPAFAGVEMGVMLTPLFHGTGPHHFSQEHIWNYCGLILSIDPVAADATGARIIQAKRNLFFKSPRPISPPILHIAAADTKFGLGNSRPEAIRLIKLGEDRDILI